MELVIITGMSGSGKNTAFKMLEDYGYFCVDNLPAKLVDHFLEVMNTNAPLENDNRYALGMDIRGGENIDAVLELMNTLFQKHTSFKLLYMDASDECLLKRYKTSRRVHPLSNGGKRSLETAIALEREKLRPIRQKADFIIDTSMIQTKDLQNRLYELFVKKEGFHNMNVTILSFGYKNGIPEEADYVLDTRFLPNPYYEEKLRPLTGNDEEIQHYCLDNPEAAFFLEKTAELLKFLIEAFQKVSKNQVVIAVGCTGGQHRSVSVANALYKRLSENRTYGLNLIHRDADRGNR